MGSAENFTAAFARIVEQRMKANGFSANEFAKAINIPRETLRRRLRGDSFKGSEMAAIAAVLGTTVTELTHAAESLGRAA